MSQEEGWAYTQISFLFTSSRKAVGKHLKPQHGSRQEHCAITHQDTSHRCGKCVTPTLILLTTKANTAPDSTRPPTEHSAWSTSDYRKLASGTFNIIHFFLKMTKTSLFLLYGLEKPVKMLYINSSTGQTECWWQHLKVLGLFGWRPRQVERWVCLSSEGPYLRFACMLSTSGMTLYPL